MTTEQEYVIQLIAEADEAFFPKFCLRVFGDDIGLFTIVRDKQARLEGISKEVVEGIVNSLWTVSEITWERDMALRASACLASFSKPREVSV